MSIIFDPKKVVRILGMIIICLIVANIVGIVSKYYFDSHRIALFDLDREGNIPTLYAAVTTLLCAGLLAVIAVARKRQEKRDYLYWGGLAIIFLFLAVDDGAAIHENIIRPLRNALNTSGFLYFAWVIPYGIFVAAMGAIYLRFLFSLPVGIRNLIIFAGTLYVGGALGFELIGGNWTELYGQENAAYALITTCEQSLQMAGILVFIYALMAYIASVLEDLSFRIGSSKQSLK
ncbi:MAG: hypothetical protein ACOYZ8_05255 [Chloroflexota bacterium]